MQYCIINWSRVLFVNYVPDKILLWFIVSVMGGDINFEPSDRDSFFLFQHNSVSYSWKWVCSYWLFFITTSVFWLFNYRKRWTKISSELKVKSSNCRWKLKCSVYCYITKNKHQILTFLKWQPVNVWHFYLKKCLKQFMVGLQVETVFFID